MGAGLAVVVVWLVWLFIRSVGRGSRVVATRRRQGWTKLDRPTLEDVFERQLEAIDGRNDVAVGINRRGRVDVTIVTPDPSATGPAQEARDMIELTCTARGLPCYAGRITAVLPRRVTNRRKVR